MYISHQRKKDIMSSFLKEECDLQFFHQNGFIRKQCPSCKDYFWTLNSEDILCGDRPCVDMTFIKSPLGKKPLSLKEVRESFLSYFEKNDHQRIKYPETGERCPVIARWRTDIYLTIASIADFQPHITSGEVPPPANPLVISQPCIRLNDLDEVGKSGRHLTIFEMMGHHAFNKQTNEIYWKNQTVAYADEYFTKKIGIPKEKIIYKEQLWDGGGNAGPCLEVLAGGLEIATLVFMNMKEDKSGKVTINNKNYAPNPLNIVDTGYGLERISWITQGTQTVYDTIFPEMINKIQKHTKQTQDMYLVYSLADHTKCLAFMLGDGIVPSNVKAGYLARLIIRRALRFIENLKLSLTLQDLVDFQLENLKQEFPTLIERKKQIDTIIHLETKRYSQTLTRGENLIKRIIEDKGKINEKELINLYDTHGMQPQVVQKIAQKQGTKITIPNNFDSMIAELHSHAEKEQQTKTTQKNLPTSEQLYYKDHYTKEFNAKVTWKNKTKNETEIILDKTAFYPEGGGQPGDIGTLSNNGLQYQVTQVKKENNSIIHIIKGDLNVGDQIHGAINWDHRYQLMKHHTGTHVVNGALRKFFGEHIWQAGSQLAVSEARFDFSHYDSISESEKSEIEKLSNQIIKQAVPVEKKVMSRNDAEKKFGFRLYQGGVPPGDTIRVLNIPDIDVEACGGTHLNNTKEVQKIRILKTERIQDGVNRIVFAAGEMVDQFQKEENELYSQIVKNFDSIYEIKNHKDISYQLKQAAKTFSVPTHQLDKTIKRFIKETTDIQKKTVTDFQQACNLLFTEWKKSQKQKKHVSEDELEILKENPDIITKNQIKLITSITKSDATVIATTLVKEKNIVAHIYDGRKLVSAASENVDIDLKMIAPEIGKILGGSGGGKPKLTTSGGPNHDKAFEALEKAKKLTIKNLKK